MKIQLQVEAQNFNREKMCQLILIIQTFSNSIDHVGIIELFSISENASRGVDIGEPWALLFSMAGSIEKVMKRESSEIG
jgi:hypothetical protein